MEDQDELMIRKSDCEDEALQANDKATLDDVGYNADRLVYRKSSLHSYCAVID